MENLYRPSKSALLSLAPGFQRAETGLPILGLSAQSLRSVLSYLPNDIAFLVLTHFT